MQGRRPAVAAFGFLLIGAAACSHQVKSAQTTTVCPESVTVTMTGTTEAAAPAGGGEIASSVPELATVHFPFGSDALSPEAEAVLEKNASWFKAHGDVRVQVGGDCDQRGAQANDLALCERRATAVRDFYEKLGIFGDRIATVAFVKNEPVCAPEDDACWRRNGGAGLQETPPALVGANFASWPEAAKLQARVMIEKYGPPQDATETALSWAAQGPWNSIVVRKDPEAPLEQEAIFPVPAADVAVLKRFGHGLHVYPDGKSLSARNDSEELNRLTLNMAYSIVSGRMTPAQADRRFEKVLQLRMSGKSSPELEKLLFAFDAPVPPAP